MNTLSPVVITPDPAHCKHLLDCVRSMRVNVGDALNDEEFTRLFQQTDPPEESGFKFVSYCDRFVMLSVPQQELANWYPEQGWILPAKEKIAKAIAAKYELTLCEPPDMKHPCGNFPNPHHHFEFNAGQETVIIAHPQFLKVRVFVLAGHTFNARTAQKPLLLGHDLLQDLSALYQ